MKFVLLAVAVIVAMLATVIAADSSLSESQYQFLFTRFVQQYDKAYETNSFFSRYNTFKSNIDKIVAHNSKKESYTMAVNQFGDLSEVEFMQMMGFKPLLSRSQQAEDAVQPCPGAAETNLQFTPIDWRTKGCLNTVKDQKSCGSCWAFSTVASVEAAYAQKHGKLIQLSEQQLVDCSSSYGNQGCDGGLMNNALDYLIKSGGSCLSTAYAYTAKVGACKKCTPAAVVKSYKYAGSGVAGLATTLQTGPVSVALAATSDMQFYASGVFTKCSSTALNHAVVAAGVIKAGSQGLNRDAFIIRNSWGTSWGQGGYIYLDASVENCLGMSTSSAKWNVIPSV